LAALGTIWLVACAPNAAPTASSASSEPALSASALASVSVRVIAPQDRAKRDGEAEVAGIAPFDPAVTIPAEIARRVEGALTICGGPRRAFGFEENEGAAPPSADRFTLCKPTTHARLLVMFATFEATNELPLPPRSVGIGRGSGGNPWTDSGPSRFWDAQQGFRLALALDPKLASPPATAPAKALEAFARAQPGFADAKPRLGFAEAKYRPRGLIRIGPQSSPLPKALERSLSQNLASFSVCYVAALLGNPSLQGIVTIDGVVERDGWLSALSAKSTLPDSGVVRCVESVADRLVLAAPEKAPLHVSIALSMSPD